MTTEQQTQMQTQILRSCRENGVTKGMTLDKLASLNDAAEAATAAIAAMWPQWVPVSVPAIDGKKYIVTDGKTVERAMYVIWCEQEAEFVCVIKPTHYTTEEEIQKILPPSPHDTTE